MIQKIKCFLGFHDIQLKTWETELGKWIHLYDIISPGKMIHFEWSCIHCGKLESYDYVTQKPIFKEPEIDIDLCIPKTKKKSTF